MITYSYFCTLVYANLLPKFRFDNARGEHSILERLKGGMDASLQATSTEKAWRWLESGIWQKVFANIRGSDLKNARLACKLFRQVSFYSIKRITLGCNHPAVGAHKFHRKYEGHEGKSLVRLPLSTFASKSDTPTPLRLSRYLNVASGLCRR